MQSEHFRILQTERQKLDSLIDEALKNGAPTSQTYDIMAQCAKIKRLAAADETLTGEEIIMQSRKVDSIVIEAEREMEGND